MSTLTDHCRLLAVRLALTAGLGVALPLCSGPVLAATVATPAHLIGLGGKLSCTMRHPASAFGALSSLPALIRADVESRVGEMARPGEPWDGGDAGIIIEDENGQIDTGAMPKQFRRRLANVVRSGDTWFVWYQHGGRGVHYHVLAYELQQRGSSPQPVMIAFLRVNFVTFDPCAATDAVLDGVSPAMEGDW